jgi:uncharacterized membrane protein
MVEKVEEVLRVNGLEKYITLLDTHKLSDLNSLATLEEADLENIGIMAMGDRKKLVKLFSMYREEAKINAKKQKKAKIRKCILISSIILVAVSGLGLAGYLFVYPIIIYKNGVKYSESGDYTNAIVAYSKSLGIRENVDIFFDRGMAYLNTGRKDIPYTIKHCFINFKD